MKKILITGADGFIGKNVIEQFDSKYKFVKITRSSKYDILDLNSFIDIDSVDIVLHLAAKTFVPESFKNPYEFYDFNIKSTLNIAEFCRIKNVSRVIYLNSYTYGTPNYLPIDEEHKISLHSPYNKSKYLSEELLLNYLDSVSNVVSLRLFNIFGKYQGEHFLIPTIIKQLSGNKIEVKNLKPKRDYLYVKDLILLIEKIIETNSISGIFNVGSGKSYSVSEIVNTILKVSKKELKIISENITRENEVMDCYADIEKLNSQLKWIPKYSFEEAISDYIKEINHV